MPRASTRATLGNRARIARSMAILPLLALGGAAAARAEAPNVVASIKPVHSLVAGVMGDIGTPHLLLTGADSPHSYAMRPSDADALSKADVIVWIGEDLETFLERPIENLGGNAISVELIHAPGMTLLNYDDDDAMGHAEDDHDEHGHDEHGHDDDHDDHGDEHHADEHHDEEEHAEESHGDDDHHGHDHHGVDAHVWLDPDNARAMVGAIVVALSQADPENADTYRANGKSLSERLEGLEAETAEQLEPFKSVPYLTFHEAFRYFDNRFGLNGHGAITVDPERQPGVQRLKEIRAEISELDNVCLFAEPQFPPKLVDVIVEGTSAKTGTVDPIGASLEPGEDLYFDLIESNRDSFVSCFSATN